MLKMPKQLHGASESRVKTVWAKKELEVNDKKQSVWISPQKKGQERKPKIKSMTQAKYF